MVAEELYQVWDGFSGEISGLTLADVIQLKGQNRFSGCVVVECGNRTGKIFFREGEVVHAEQGWHKGKAAFFNIVIWPTGNIKTLPKVATTIQTISEPYHYLIMEALQLLDEGKLTPYVPEEDTEQEKQRDAAKKESTPPPTARKSITPQLKAIPGVIDSVFHNLDGSPLENTSFEGETLAAHSAYIADFGNKVGSFLQIGSVRSVALNGEGVHLVSFEGKGNNYLSVSIEGSMHISVVESDIRKSLAAKRDANR